MTKDEALTLALETLEFNQSVWRGKKEALTAIKEALAQPEEQQSCDKQEPVTWRNAAIRVGEDLCSVGPFRYYDMTAEQWLDWALSVVTVHTPPKRPWVSLTREEINSALSKYASWYDFAAHLENILKEKNQ